MMLRWRTSGAHSCVFCLEAFLVSPVLILRRFFQIHTYSSAYLLAHISPSIVSTINYLFGADGGKYTHRD